MAHRDDQPLSLTPALRAAAVEQAFADGDFARARSLGEALSQSPAGLSQEARARQRRLQAALRFDPYVAWVGLGSLAACGAAWAYALAQH